MPRPLPWEPEEYEALAEDESTRWLTGPFPSGIHTRPTGSGESQTILMLANGVLIDVIGGTDMTISEAEKAAEEIQSRVGQNARIIWGAAIDPAMDKTVRVMLVATGVKSKQILGRPSSEKRYRGVGDVDLVR